jgi:hypothetical protein
MAPSIPAGWEVYKRIDTPEFHNVHYLKEMLFQVFSALDRAQRKLGFSHADLGMRNVMEHFPQTWEEIPGGAAAAGHVPHIPGYTCNTNGSRLPLGPKVEFKIIDFGISKMSAKLAEAAGGREAQEHVARMQTMFGHGRRVIFEGKSKRSGLEMESSDFEHEPMGWLKRLLRRRSSDQQFHMCRLKTTPRAGTPDLSSAPSETVSTDDDASSSSGEPQRYATQAPDEVVLSEEEVRRTCKWAALKKKKSPIETLYRSFWHRKGEACSAGAVWCCDNAAAPQGGGRTAASSGRAAGNYSVPSFAVCVCSVASGLNDMPCQLLLCGSSGAQAAVAMMHLLIHALSPSIVLRRRCVPPAAGMRLARLKRLLLVRGSCT